MCLKIKEKTTDENLRDLLTSILVNLASKRSKMCNENAAQIIQKSLGLNHSDKSTILIGNVMQNANQQSINLCDLITEGYMKHLVNTINLSFSGTKTESELNTAVKIFALCSKKSEKCRKFLFKTQKCKYGI
jgi:hypothetical protein